MNSDLTDEKWLEWARALQGITQSGLKYTQSPYDKDRYEKVRTIAAEILAESTGQKIPKVLDLLSKETEDATPKVAARGVCIKDGKFLMILTLTVPL